MSRNTKRLRWASIILLVGAVGMIAASLAIVSRQADPNSSVGRHLWAGALANLSLAIVEMFIALFPLRRGERWAFWALIVPLIFYGAPILILDAAYVSRENLFNTLAPQALGLSVILIGLVLAAREIFKR